MTLGQLCQRTRSFGVHAEGCKGGQEGEASGELLDVARLPLVRGTLLETLERAVRGAPAAQTGTGSLIQFEDHTFVAAQFERTVHLLTISIEVGRKHDASQGSMATGVERRWLVSKVQDDEEVSTICLSRVGEQVSGGLHRLVRAYGERELGAPEREETAIEGEHGSLNCAFGGNVVSPVIVRDG